MKQRHKLPVVTFMALMLPSISFAVDESSTAYKVGGYFGYAFIAVLFLLVIKKLLGK